MLCNSNCPRRLDNCSPISNIVSDDETSIVCIGYHDGRKTSDHQDIFRHCFKSHVTDSMFDYDYYDIKSVMSIFSEAILIDELKGIK